MTFKRIVANILADEVDRGRAFFTDVPGLRVVMDFGWIMTFAGDLTSVPQLSVATEGGSGSALPDLSVEVDNVTEGYQRVVAAGLPIEYGPTSEPWGVARFYVRDPFGRLLSILARN